MKRIVKKTAAALLAFTLTAAVFSRVRQYRLLRCIGRRNG